jgi:hypothetical protein
VISEEQLILAMFMSAQTCIFDLVEKKCLLTTSELDSVIQNVRIGVSSSAPLSQPPLSSPFPPYSALRLFMDMLAKKYVS